MMAVDVVGKIMVVGVVMDDGVGMGRAVVGMGEGVMVGVGVVSDQRVSHHQSAAAQHDRQGDQIPARQPLMQERKGQKCPDKGRDGDSDTGRLSGLDRRR